MVQIPGPTQNNLSDAAPVQEFIICIINPSNRLCLEGIVKHFIQNQNDLFFRRILGQKFKYRGYRRGILALGNVGHQLDAAHRLPALPGSQNMRAIQTSADLSRCISQLPKQCNHRGQVIRIVQRTRDHGIAVGLLRVLQRQAVVPAVDLRHQIVPLRRMQAAPGAIKIPDLPVVPVPVFRPAAANRANGKIIGAGRQRIGVLVGYAEGDAPVVPSQKATQGVIRVHNYHRMRASRYGSLQAVINIRRVRIAKHGIPRQVADQNIIRLKRRNIPKRDQLVHFDHRCILGCTIPNTDCIQKASGNTGMVVGAPIIERNAHPLLAQQAGNQTGDGRLPVGSGHHDGALRLGHIF